MAAVAYLVAHPEIARAPCADRLHRRRGDRTRHRPLRPRALRRRLRLHARRRRVVGEIENETFSAIQLKVTFPGVGIASRHGERQARQPDQARGAVPREPAEGHALARDHGGPRGLRPPERRSPAARGLHGHAASCATTTGRRSRSTRRSCGGSRGGRSRRAGDVTFERWDQYRNMREALDRGAARRRRGARGRPAGRPRADASRSIRGGTDGSRLTEMGLPTPNIYAGGQRVPLGARVDLGAGPGDLRRDGRRAAEALGRACLVHTRPRHVSSSPISTSHTGTG